ncbi:MAG: hypothetical protein JW912_03185 [Sedimentisphaerales bacterium]|nr:hypothetical protein [Sedimentisphaerales bacterium]
MDQSENRNDMVDATDCLEAISVFKSMKNFLFMVSVICLLLVQGIFWLEDSGSIEKASVSSEVEVVDEALAEATKAESTVVEEEAAVPEAESSQKEKMEALAKIATGEPEGETVVVPEEAGEAEIQAEPKRSIVKELAYFFIPKKDRAINIVKACNFILVVVTCSYSLSLFMIIKISLAGRLGGINHISRAFFRSLFAFIFILPWQKCFPGIISGAIYDPSELFCVENIAQDPSVYELVAYYFRFVGLWVIVFVLLFLAQMRARKWSQATLRRLGIIQ